MNNNAMFKIGDKIHGKYNVFKVLRGGMGEVYLCFDSSLDAFIAYKTFKKEYVKTEMLRTSLEKECRVWISLGKHKNLVECMAIENINGQYFLMLDWVVNERNGNLGSLNLRNRINDGQLEVEQAINYTIQIFNGLLHAHSMQPGIIHCDIKPENILIDYNGVAKITDWGLARIFHGVKSNETRSQLMHFSGLGGTPLYMAPEQWLGGEIDERTDLYATGCVLYEMLTGKFPFNETSYSDLRDAHLKADIPKLQSTFSKLPQRLDSFIHDCLAKKKENRFPSIELALEDFLNLYKDLFSKDPPSILTNENIADATYYSMQGISYRVLGEYEKSYRNHDQAIKLEPNRAELYTNRGVTHEYSGDFAKAINDHNTAIQINPSLAASYIHRAIIYRKMGEYQKGLADCNIAIQLDPQYPFGYTVRAEIFAEINDHNAAIKDYQISLKLDNTDALTFCNYGTLLIRIENYREAIQAFNESINLNPNDLDAINNRAAAFLAIDDYRNAIYDLSYAVELNPNDPDFYQNRGIAYAGLKKFNDAINDFTKALEIFSKSKDSVTSIKNIYKQRAGVLLRMGRYDECINDLDAILEIAPKDVNALFSKGVALSQLGKTSDAIETLNLAKELGEPYAQKVIDMINQKKL